MCCKTCGYQRGQMRWGCCRWCNKPRLACIAAKVERTKDRNQSRKVRAMRINPSGVVREPAYREGGYRPERSKAFPGRWCVVHVKPKTGDMADVTIDMDNLTEQDAERRIRELYDAVAPKPKKATPTNKGIRKKVLRKKSQSKFLIKGRK